MGLLGMYSEAVLRLSTLVERLVGDRLKSLKKH